MLATLTAGSSTFFVQKLRIQIAIYDATIENSAMPPENSQTKFLG